MLVRVLPRPAPLSHGVGPARGNSPERHRDSSPGKTSFDPASLHPPAIPHPPENACSVPAPCTARPVIAHHPPQSGSAFPPSPLAARAAFRHAFQPHPPLLHRSRLNHFPAGRALSHLPRWLRPETSCRI